MSPDPRERMLECAASPGGDIAMAALWLAADDHPEVDVTAVLQRVSGLAEELADELDGARGQEAVAVVRDLLQRRIGLRRSGGADPRSHYLHCVLERGAGIPIACAALWMGVGRRAGLGVEGIGLPGHFVVRVDDVLVEPSHGEVLDEPATRDLVSVATGREMVHLEPLWLRPASTRLMLARMSRNLRGCYATMEEWSLAIRSADRCVALYPDEASERRDRGLLLFRAGRTGAALSDLRHYLGVTPPDRPDREPVEEIVARIRASLN